MTTADEATNKPDDSSVPSTNRPAGDQRTRAERYAATQASADGIQGNAKKPNKSDDEKLGAQMADMK